MLLYNSERMLREDDDMGTAVHHYLPILHIFNHFVDI
jgi:hypothetical protein